jgi:hypothetical protein
LNEAPISAKRIAPPAVLSILLLCAAGILFLGIWGWATWIFIVAPGGKGFDFYWIWAGGRAVLAGQNPYGAEVTRLIQAEALRAVQPVAGYQFEFSYPASVAVALLPLLALPFQAAVLVWNTLQLPLLAGALAAGLVTLGQRVRPASWAGLLLLGFLGFRYPAMVYTLGQLTLFILFCGVLAAWLYRRGHVRLAAVALALTSIRPDIGLVLTILALCLTWRAPRRSEFRITLIGTAAGLALLPMIFIGFWPAAWLPILQNYADLNPYIRWPLSGLGSAGLGWLAAALCTAWAGASLWRAIRQPNPVNQRLAVSALVILAQLGLKQTGLYNLSYLLVPALILWSCARRPWLRGLILASLLLPWLYFGFAPAREVALLAAPLQFLILQMLVSLDLRGAPPQNAF